jgi:hypothetical protein
MKTTGLFTTHAYTVAAKAGQPLRLVLWGDVHRDAPLHAGEAWQRDLADWRAMVASGRPCAFLGMGDYLDGCSTSERRGLRAAGLHESTSRNLEAAWQKSVETLTKEIEFMRPRLLGLIEGNHYPEFSDSTTGTQRMARALDCRYLGVSSFIRLTLAMGTNKAALDIWAHHGAGGARLTGGSINRVEQMAEGGIADLYVMGHDHRRLIVPGTPKLYLRGNPKTGLEIKQREVWLARTGSYLRGYVDGQVSYIADSARSPASIGHVALDVTPRYRFKAGRRTITLEMNGIS